MKIALIAAAGLAVSATASAQVIDLSGASSNGAPGTVVGSVSAGAVTEIAFDIVVTANSPSWGSEVNILIEGPGGFSFSADGSDTDFSDDGPADLTFGWGDTSGTFSFSGSATGLSGGAGTYTVTIFDDFNDGVDPDNTFAQGSTVTLIPTPGAAALLGLGGVAATRRRR